ncbi:PE-PGRS family protein [Streptomyces albus]|uniref:PE-PGRS family protein n=2 Tax=Streptomyces albus subsp. albus TaxID=67257 RepID=H6D564_STRA4|nr:putative membrane protein [Streptomyces albus]AJE80661.1 PE-PGRS family protein [Streptomyces albus]AOU74972.1 PE-PGRS family protein [Streptomyces albus]CCD31885.1 hypothetical protein [Streptomyces albus subsp. albus]
MNPLKRLRGAARVDLAGLRGPMETAGLDAWQRLTTNFWPVLQQALAAGAAWYLARHVVDHHLPLFAPIATIVALNAPRGERGVNAVRLMLGVSVGILLGEASMAVIGGHGYLTLGAAVFASMLAALVLGGERIVIAQASVSAIIAIATGTEEAGPQRLTDALIGTGVAIVVTQFLLPADPVVLLHSAQKAFLKELSDSLYVTARDLDRADNSLSEKSLEQQRAVHNRLVELGVVRISSVDTARRSPVWWRRKDRIVHESEHMGRLEVLGGSCLMLTRVAVSEGEEGRSRLAPVVSDLASILGRLAKDPGDVGTRQRAANRMLDLSRHVAEFADDPQAPAADSWPVVRLIAADVMMFAGVDEDEAYAAAHEGAEQLGFPAPSVSPLKPMIKSTPLDKYTP